MRGWFLISMIILACPLRAQKDFTDTLSTSQGDLVVHVLGHASVWFEYNGISIYVDPYGKFQDFTGMTKADLLLITHADKDHFDTAAVAEILKPESRIIYTQACADIHKYSGMDTVMANGDSVCILDMQIIAVPAYNITATKHPKGVGNGYVIQYGNKKVYLSGDTEKIPEMADLENINLAFLPLSQPYGMTPEMMAETVLLIEPGILVPYHYDNADITPLLDLLEDIPGLKVWTGEPDTPSGFINFASDADILIRPNPAEDLLFIDGFFPYASACIFDMAGRKIFFCSALNKGALDIGFLQEGQYILQVMALDRTFVGIFFKH